MNKLYSIGLDIGIASVGWSVIDDSTGRIEDLGVRLFSAQNSANNLERRSQRGGRRLTRRRRTRLNDAKKILASIQMTEDSKLKNSNPYELRVRGLEEQLSKGEIYKVVVHILKKRGISYLDEDSSDGAEDIENYKAQVQKNRDLESKLTPGQIQLSRLKENKRIKTGLNAHGEYQLNVFTVGAYAQELELILRNQQSFYPEITDEVIQKFVGNNTAEKAGLIYRKRPYYHGPGNAANPSPYGRWKDYKINGKPAENIFDQLIGTDLQGELRASGISLSAQQYNLLNDLNNLVLPRENKKVTTQEKEEILTALMEKEIKVFGATQLAKMLGFKKEEIKGWRVDKKGKPEIHSLKSYREWRKVFNENGLELNEISVEVVDKLATIVTLNTDREGIENTLAVELPDLSEEIRAVIIENFGVLGKAGSNRAWHSFSIKTLNLLIPELLHTSDEQNTILERLQLKKNLRNKYAEYHRLPFKEVLEEIYNPTVKTSVRQAFRVMNDLLKKYGKDSISYVTVEMPRDRNEDDQKKNIKNIQAANEQRKKASEKYFLENSGWSPAQLELELRRKGFAAKLGYYYEQQGRCAYSGKKISPEDLKTGATEIDHVIPLSISLDDSINNKVLVKASANQEKGQRSPYQAFMDGADLGQTWEDYQSWVNQTIKKSHKRKIMLETRDIFDPEVREGFIARNLNDTRYSSRVILNTLQSFFYQSDTKVKVVTGSFTHTLRKKWGDALEKSRETHHHHAVDATLCAVAPFVEISRFKYHYSDDGEKFMIDTITGEKIPYREFKKMKPDERRTYIPKWDDFISQLVPLHLYDKIKFSHQVDKKWNRKVSDATLYSTREVEKVETKRNKEVKTNETFIIGKINNIYTVQGWKEFDKKKDKLLMKDIDKKTYNLLLDIASSYPDFEEIEEANGKIKKVERSPFERYCHENNVSGIQKYSQKGNGPLIRSLKYYEKKLGNHINITRDETGKRVEKNKHNKKTVLLTLNPWRTDVYFNSENRQYELLGVKYNHLQFVGHRYGIPKTIYGNLKKEERIGENSEFCFSLYRKDGIKIEYGEEVFEGLFHSRTTSNRNYFEAKPIHKSKWDDKEELPIFGKVSSGRLIKGLKEDMNLVKFNTDCLGKRYYVTHEQPRDIIEDK